MKKSYDDPTVSSDETRFEHVLAEFGPALARLARIYEHEPSRAEDLLQDICLAVWKALPRHREEASLRTFVFRIAHNRGLTHGWRESKRSTLPLQAAIEASDPRPSAEDRADQRQRREVLLRALRELPLSLRQPVSLKLEGLSAPEIGEILEVSPGAVRVRLHRAQKQLAERLPSLFQARPQEKSP